MTTILCDSSHQLGANLCPNEASVKIKAATSTYIASIFYYCETCWKIEKADFEARYLTIATQPFYQIYRMSGE